MSGSTSERSILIVDDDPQIRFVLKHLFEKDGFSVATAESADAGLALLAGASYSVVITDLRMPVKTGVDLVLEMRQKGIATPVLILSSTVSDVSPETLSRLGRAECLEKPFRTEALREAIARLMVPGKIPS